MPPPSPAPAPLPAPTGQIFAYAASSDDSSDIAVSIYKVLDDGALEPAGTVLATSGALSASIHPSGRFAYVINEIAGRISAHAIDGESGMLELTMTLDDLNFNGRMHIHPSGQFAYLAGDNAVLIYGIDGAGMLVNGRTFGVDSGVEQVALDPSGSQLYVAGMNNMLTVYSIDAMGDLAFQGSVGTAERCSALLVSPAGRSIHVAAGHSILTHTIGPAGQLGAPSSVDALNVREMAVAPSGKYLYALTSGGTGSGADVSVYEITEAGELIARGEVDAIDVEGELAFHPSGGILYTADGAGNTVSRYTVDQFTGALAEMPPAVAAGLGTYGICVARVAAVA